jgi:hypothetical protein
VRTGSVPKLTTRRGNIGKYALPWRGRGLKNRPSLFVREKEKGKRKRKMLKKKEE